MTRSYKVLNRLLSHCKWNTRTSLFPPYLSASLFNVLDLSLFLTAYRMANCKRRFFFLLPPWLYYFTKTKTQSQPNLLVTAKPFLSHRFSQCPRFLVQLLPDQMSPCMMFLIHTLLPAQWVPAQPGLHCFLGSFLVDEPRLEHSA